MANDGTRLTHPMPSLRTKAVHEQKAAGARLDERMSGTMKVLGSLLSPQPYISSAIRVMEKVEVTGGNIKDFDECMGKFIDFGNLLVEYGEVRGFDISGVKEFLENRENTR